MSLAAPDAGGSQWVMDVLQQHRRAGPEQRADRLTAALVAQGLLDPASSDRAAAVIQTELGSRSRDQRPVRGRLVELAAYLGGVLVASAAALLLIERWSALSDGQQVAAMAGVTGALLVCGLLVGSIGTRLPALRRGDEPARRVLVAVFLAATAGAAAATAGLQADRVGARNEVEAFAMFGTFLALALVGYLVMPTVVGQLAIGAAVFPFVVALLDLVGDVTPLRVGLVVLPVGLGWLLLAERGVWSQPATARVVGSALTVAGAQVAVLVDGPPATDTAWAGYLLLLLVGAAALTAYLLRPAWPYLAAGVVALTLVVPEALLDWTDDALGPAGALLVAGLTLVAVSLVGFRLGSPRRAA